jgi:hypothetical protein
MTERWRMINKIQFTEQQANEMLQFLHSDIPKSIIEGWKRKGYIKKTKLEVVREWVNLKKGMINSTAWKEGFILGLRECAAKYEEAIKEILEENYDR